MGVQLGFDLASDAQSAAQQFIALLDEQKRSVDKLFDSVIRFNEKGEEVSQTFKAIVQGGSTVEVTLRDTGKGFELLSGKVDDAVASMKRMKEAEAALAAQQKADLAASRRTDANSAEVAVSGLLNRPNQNANQINAAEAAVQKIRAAIESGSVSLARFQQLYNQIASNPKQLIPNLTAEEASVTKALRTLQTGFDVTGDKAQRMGERLTISWQGVLRLFEAQVIKRITGALQSSFVEGAQSAVDFSVRIAEIGTISQHSGISTNEWSDGIRRLSSQFGNSQADVAEAAYMALSNQVAKGTQNFEFLNTALRFSKATVTSAADSVNLLSSAMKSFNIPTGDAERVASIFFKTIELGRVRGAEMADTFGRVGTIAADAGVKLEEVSAAITALTVKGMKFSDASTLISNLLVKLVRPTDEMKKLFAEWGVASGQAAIATFGFSGVLNKLDAEAQKGSTRLGELFNQIRAFRGVSGLTGSSFGEFTKNLAEIKEGGTDFNNAVDIVMESFGDRLRRQLNQVKVYFSEQFGDQFVQAAVKIAESLGGMANVLTQVEKFLTPVITGLIAYKVGAIAATIVTNIYAASVSLVGASSTATAATQAQLAASTNAAATSMGTATVAAGGLSAAIGTFTQLFTASFTLGMLLFNQDDEKRIENITRNLEKIAATRMQAIAAQDTRPGNFRQGLDLVRQDYEERYKIILQYNRNNIILADQVRDKTIATLKETTEQTKVSAKTFFDTIGNNLKQLREAANQAKQMIEASLKASEGIQRKLGENIFDTRLKYASEGRMDSITGFVVDDQKIALIKSRINEITALARSKFKEGTKESVEDARKLYGDVEKLTSELFDVETKKQRANFDEQVRRGTIQPSGMDFDPVTGSLRSRYEFTVRTAEVEKQLKAIADERLIAERALRAEKQRQMQLAEDLELREKARVKTIQQAITEIEKLRIYNDRGEVDKKYQDDPRKALIEFDRQAAVARQAASQLELSQQLQTLDFLSKQRKALEDEVNAAILGKRVRTEQETTQMTAKAVQDRLTQVQQRYDEAQSRIASSSRKLIVDLETISRTDISAPSSTRLQDSSAEERRRVLALRTEVQVLGELKEAAKQSIEEFNKDTTFEKFKKAQEALDAFITRYKYYIELSTGEKIENLPADSPGMQRLRQLEADRAALQGAASSRGRAELDLVSMAREGERMKESIGSLPNIFQLMEESIGKATPAIIDSFQQIIDKTDALIMRAMLANTQLREMGGVEPGARFVPNGRFFGGYPSYFAEGGYVDWQSRGSDSIPAMLNKREMVMNSEASDNWSPLLKAINGGLTPNQAFGGSSVTNVGDININMSGNQPPDSNVRTFAKTLRRALRRGTVSLD